MYRRRPEQANYYNKCHARPSHEPGWTRMRAFASRPCGGSTAPPVPVTLAGMRTRTALLFGIFLFAGACGGRVETGNPGDAGGAAGSASTICSSFKDCCNKTCQAAAGLPCAASWNCGCDSIVIASSECRSRLADLYRCQVGLGQQVYACDANGEIQPRCGFCVAETDAANKACGYDGKCVP